MPIYTNVDYFLSCQECVFGADLGGDNRLLSVVRTICDIICPNKTQKNFGGGNFLVQGRIGVYNGEIVAGSLLFKESKVLAKLLLEDCSDGVLQQKLFLDNILQKRSQATIKRQATLIKKRLSTLYPDAWKLIVDGSVDVANQLLLIAAIKHSRLLGDFLLKIVKGHISLFNNQITMRDWEKFIEECSLIEPQVSNWSETTQKKLRQVIFRILAEAKIIDTTRSLKILPFFLQPEVKRLLVKNNEDYVIKCLELS